MSKGKAKVNYLDMQGHAAYQTVPSWGFLYETSLIKSEKWNIGDRVVTPEGRVFRYAKATNIISHTTFGLKFYGRLADGIAYTAPLQTELATSREITVDAGDSGDHAEDEFRGGYIMIHTHGDNHHMTRYITGNTASDADGYITLYVDAPWIKDIEVAYGVEVCPNPYASVRVKQAAHGGGGDKYTSVAGMPLVQTAVANQYLWLQTWGPIWINPAGASLQDAGIATSERRLVFDYEGSVCIQEDAVDATDDCQHAGFIIDRNSVGVMPAPLCMLQISI